MTLRRGLKEVGSKQGDNCGKCSRQRSQHTGKLEEARMAGVEASRASVEMTPGSQGPGPVDIVRTLATPVSVLSKGMAGSGLFVCVCFFLNQTFFFIVN